MGSNLFTPTATIVLLGIVWLAGALPAFVVCRRRAVRHAGLAFVPFFGPWIAILRSVRINPWFSLLVLIPIVNLVFGVWTAFSVPARHSRTTLWGLWFILPLLNLIGFWVYALTLPDERYVPMSANARSGFRAEALRAEAQSSPRFTQTSTLNEKAYHPQLDESTSLTRATHANEALGDAPLVGAAGLASQYNIDFGSLVESAGRRLDREIPEDEEITTVEAERRCRFEVIMAARVSEEGSRLHRARRAIDAAHEAGDPDTIEAATAYYDQELAEAISAYSLAPLVAELRDALFYTAARGADREPWDRSVSFGSLVHNGGSGSQGQPSNPTP